MSLIDGPYGLMPDVGEVLNDKSLSDISDPFFFFNYEGCVAGNEEEEGIRSRVLYLISGSSGEPFMQSLSPPPTHLMLTFDKHVMREHVESLEQYWLASSNPPYLFVYLDLENAEQEARASMSTLLHNLPPHCHLLLWADKLNNETELEEIVDALLQSQCQVDFLGLKRTSINVVLSPQYACKLGGRCRSLWCPISLKSGDIAAFSLLSNLMSSSDCKLLELGFESYS